MSNTDKAKSAYPHCDDGMMHSEAGLRLHKSEHHQDGRNDSDDSECQIISRSTKDSKLERFFKPIEKPPKRGRPKKKPPNAGRHARSTDPVGSGQAFEAQRQNPAR